MHPRRTNPKTATFLTSTGPIKQRGRTILGYQLTGTAERRFDKIFEARTIFNKVSTLYIVD
jgi:hypothetical protein